MMKFVFSLFKVNLFAINQSHSLQSSWLTTSSNDFRFFVSIMFVLLANRKKSSSSEDLYISLK